MMETLIIVGLALVTALYIMGWASALRLMQRVAELGVQLSNEPVTIRAKVASYAMLPFVGVVMLFPVGRVAVVRSMMNERKLTSNQERGMLQLMDEIEKW